MSSTRLSKNISLNVSTKHKPYYIFVSLTSYFQYYIVTIHLVNKTKRIYLFKAISGLYIIFRIMRQTIKKSGKLKCL